MTGILTKRQVNLHAHILRATARHLGGGADDWPVLVTEVSADQAGLLQDLHRLCDWVVTADRNAGIEYFDSPRELPRVYENYIIDCVPERDDLGFMQLITSTSSFDEVVNLLDGALGEMGLSASPRNCTYLLEALKAVSGRLALRLAGAGNAAQEMIAVALAQQQCACAASGDPAWLPLADGFLIPLDDVPQLFREPGKALEGGEQRADLLYVSATKKGGLRLVFVEVKFRRYLKTAPSPDLAEGMSARSRRSVAAGANCSVPGPRRWKRPSTAPGWRVSCASMPARGADTGCRRRRSIPPCGRSTGWFAGRRTRLTGWTSSGSASSFVRNMADSSRCRSSMADRPSCGCSGRTSCPSRGWWRGMMGKVRIVLLARNLSRRTGRAIPMLSLRRWVV